MSAHDAPGFPTRRSNPPKVLRRTFKAPAREGATCGTRFAAVEFTLPPSASEPFGFCKRSSNRTPYNTGEAAHWLPRYLPFPCLFYLILILPDPHGNLYCHN